MTPAEMSLLAAEIVKQLAPMLSGGSVAISPEKYLTAHEAAQVLGVSQATIERLTAKGAIPSHKVGRCRRYLASELQAAKEAGAQAGEATADRHTRTDGGESPPDQAEPKKPEAVRGATGWLRISKPLR